MAQKIDEKYWGFRDRLKMEVAEGPVPWALWFNYESPETINVATASPDDYAMFQRALSWVGENRGDRHTALELERRATVLGRRTGRGDCNNVHSI